MRLLIRFAVILSLCAFCLGQQSQKPEAEWTDPDRSTPAGTLYRTFSSQLAGTDVSYLVYLPPGYERDTSKKYPVIYWLHGLGGSQRTGAKFVAPLDAAIRAGKAPEMIAVLVNGMRDSLYCDSLDGKRPVESVIIKELVPHIDRTWRTIPERGARAVEGFSMGGFGAPHLAFKYPDVFGCVGAMAGLFENIEEVRSERPDVFRKVAGDNLEWAKANTPTALLKKNLSSIRNRMFIRVVVGGKDRGLARSQAAHQLLEELDVQHDYQVVPDVNHNPERLYQALGHDGFSFYETAFAHYLR